MVTEIPSATQTALYCMYVLLALPFAASVFVRWGRPLRVVLGLAMPLSLLLVFGASTQVQFTWQQCDNNLHTPVSSFLLKPPAMFARVDELFAFSNPTPVLLVLWTLACAALAELAARLFWKKSAPDDDRHGAQNTRPAVQGPRASHAAMPFPAGASSPSPWIIQGCVGVILLAGVLTYLNSFQGVFILDDPFAISDNDSIKDIEQFGKVLMPPPSGHPQAGRPMLNLSLAINYAIGGMNIWGYHAMNVVIHLLVSLVLFGVLRRTLLMPRIPEDFRKHSSVFALAVVLVWMVHPLGTESVTYICQRAEAIVALFYLLTLYCAIRTFTAQAEQAGPDAAPGFSAAGGGWQVLAVASCLLGMASKEVMVSAPLMVLLYDRAFFSGTFKDAFRKRPTLYPQLAVCWAMLLFLVIGAGTRGGTAAGGKETVTSLEYARSQFGVLLHYVRLSFWPDQLCIDYKWLVANTFWSIVPQAVVILLLVAATVWGVIRNSPWGLLGALSFMVLAPTSTILPIADLAFEHRTYLPLAGLAGVVVLGLYRCAGLLASMLPSLSEKRKQIVALGVPSVLVLVAVVGLCHATLERNKVYRSEIEILLDAVKTAPHNTRAQSNLGYWLWAGGRFAEAEEHCRVALHYKKVQPEAHVNLGNALIYQGKREEAIQEYYAALQDDANCSSVHFNLGVVLTQDKRIPEAAAHYEAALKLNPRYMEVHNNLGMLLANTGHLQEGLTHFELAMILQPGAPVMRSRLDALLEARRALLAGERIVPRSTGQ